VIYPYEKSGEFQLSLELGERVELLEITSDKTWYRYVINLLSLSPSYLLFILITQSLTGKITI
jgi:hypothetical protein